MDCDLVASKKSGYIYMICENCKLDQDHSKDNFGSLRGAYHVAVSADVSLILHMGSEMYRKPLEDCCQ